VSAIKTFMAITSVAGAVAFSAPAYADTPVDPGSPMAQDEGAPLPGGDPEPADPNWVDPTPIPYDEGAPLPGGDPEPADPNWVDDTKPSYDEGAPLPGGDPEPAPETKPDPDPQPDPIRMIAAVVLADAR
jgi:hypothetical protein